MSLLLHITPAFLLTAAYVGGLRSIARGVDKTDARLVAKVSRYPRP